MLSALLCRASISGDVNKADSARVLGPHNATNTEPATRPSFSRTAGASLRDSTQMIESSKQRGATAASTSTDLQPVFELGGRFETRSLAGLAAELFKDPAFTELCDKGLNGTLQRTKDGATAESRIQELAGASHCLDIACTHEYRDSPTSAEQLITGIILGSVQSIGK